MSYIISFSVVKAIRCSLFGNTEYRGSIIFDNLAICNAELNFATLALYEYSVITFKCILEKSVEKLVLRISKCHGKQIGMYIKLAAGLAALSRWLCRALATCKTGVSWAFNLE